MHATATETTTMEAAAATAEAATEGRNSAAF
jgi:hypothetical protein